MSLFRERPVRVLRGGERARLHRGRVPARRGGHGRRARRHRAQAAQAAENLLAALAEAGTGPDAILRTTIYVVADERADLVRVWDVVAERLGRAPSTLLGVSFLGYPDQFVEIEAIAAVNSTG